MLGVELSAAEMDPSPAAAGWEAGSCAHCQELWWAAGWLHAGMAASGSPEAAEPKLWLSFFVGSFNLGWCG